MKQESQTIKCDVASCDYQESDRCTLNEIKVGCTCGCNEATQNQETLCQSFRCNNQNKKNA
ncbi:MAG: DUF1540 domain-containing protein [bacterium]|nr:DUF1540 domain-containing protein [bacterium]